jgi:methionine-rich copper-binding protein CopC
MSVTKWCVGAALILLAATAHAHAHLTAAVPADGSAGKAPEHIVLTFSEPARITVMTLQRAGEEARTVAPLPAEMSARISIPLPRLVPGKYTLGWRVVSADGHVMPGQLHFTVLESAAAGGGGG